MVESWFREEVIQTCNIIITRRVDEKEFSRRLSVVRRWSRRQSGAKKSKTNVALSPTKNYQVPPTQHFYIMPPQLQETNPQQQPLARRHAGSPVRRSTRPPARRSATAHCGRSRLRLRMRGGHRGLSNIACQLAAGRQLHVANKHIPDYRPPAAGGRPCCHRPPTHPSARFVSPPSNPCPSARPFPPSICPLARRGDAIVVRHFFARCRSERPPARPPALQATISRLCTHVIGRRRYEMTCMGPTRCACAAGTLWAGVRPTKAVRVGVCMTGGGSFRTHDPCAGRPIL